jgi:hypothetical protein
MASDVREGCGCPPTAAYGYLPGYYAVFSTDRDGLTLELVHVPG